VKTEGDCMFWRKLMTDKTHDHNKA